MVEEPDRIRNDIEVTRAELTRNVDRLADKTSPGRVARRQWSTLREKVMGTPRHAADRTTEAGRSAVGTVQDVTSQAGDKASAAAQNVAGTVRETPQKVTAAAQGNPLAAGVIAFGVGLLAASLFPATEAEKRAGQQIKDNAGDLADQVREPVMQMKDEVQGSVQQAAGGVKDTARGAAQTTTDQAKSSAQDAAAQTRQAARSAT